jgi:type II secretory pathway component GspD/PulD (secretin)
MRVPAAAAPEQSVPTSGTGSDSSTAGAPIFITRGADGRLLASSRDTEALDRLEELLARLAPPRKDYEVFYLKYAPAQSVRFLLEDYFAAEKKETSETGRRQPLWFGGFGDDGQGTKKPAGPRLSQRRPLKFIDDDATNSILVQGATSELTRQIGEIIALYDRPEKPNSKASRITKPFPIKHNKASVLAGQIKDVFRDLLSANDKALESYNQSKNQANRGGPFGLVFGSGDQEENGRLSQGRFRGYLSVAADDTTNTLLVSCPATLMSTIVQVVSCLDQAAVPSVQSFQVLKIAGGVDAAALQKRLTAMLKPAAPKIELPTATENPQPWQRSGPRSESPGGTVRVMNGQPMNSPPPPGAFP